MFPHSQEKEEDALPKAAGYVTLYEFTGQDSTQLSFKQGETVGGEDVVAGSMLYCLGDDLNYLYTEFSLVPSLFVKSPHSSKLGGRDWE